MTMDIDRKQTRWEREQSMESPFNYHLGCKDGLSLHESYLANMSDDEYLDYCQATGRG